MRNLVSNDKKENVLSAMESTCSVSVFFFLNMYFISKCNENKTGRQNTQIRMKCTRGFLWLYLKSDREKEGMNNKWIWSLCSLKEIFAVWYTFVLNMCVFKKRFKQMVVYYVKWCAICWTNRLMGWGYFIRYKMTDRVRCIFISLMWRFWRVNFMHSWRRVN